MADKSHPNGKAGRVDARPPSEPWTSRSTRWTQPALFFLVFLPYCALVTRYAVQLHCQWLIDVI